mgnify:CR=1 FL=1
MKPETIAIHAGRRVDPATGAITLPLHLSTTFERASDGSFPTGYEYVRDNNPNRAAFETCLATLEGGETGIAFASGMAAIAAVIEAHSTMAGRRILMPHDMYFGIRALIAETDFSHRFDIASVDMTDLDAVQDALAEQTTSLVWIETPSNPLIHITDIKAIARLAHAAGALVAVDNTWATPVLQHPLRDGADIVVHSATKYIGGHSDLMLGVVVLRGNTDVEQRLRAIQKHKGGIPSPFDCWLALRGVQSLSVRMRAHCDGAMAVALALRDQPLIKSVLYPGLPDHPGHHLASAQMSGYGGMMSLIVAGGERAAMRLAANLQLIVRATSLGGTHSLIEHRASVEGRGTLAPPGLLRLSIGLEHPDDLIADLTQALSNI